MNSINYKQLLKTYNGYNFIISTDIPYFDETTNTTKYKIYYGERHTEIKTMNINGIIINDINITSCCKILEVDSNIYIKVEYNNDGFKYFEYIPKDRITNIQFPSKDKDLTFKIPNTQYNYKNVDSQWYDYSSEKKDDEGNITTTTITMPYAIENHDNNVIW